LAGAGVVGLVLALAVALAVSAAALRLGPRLGYLDVPDDPLLKAHQVPAVPLGGVAIFLGVHLGMAVTGRVDLGLMAASGLVLALGLVDDRLGVSPVVRLLIESAAGVVLVLVAAVPLAPGPLGLVAGTVLVVVCVNAVNLFDGLDGLAGSSAMVAAIGLSWLGAARGLEGSFGLMLAAALAGFLVYNWHPARIFLGDNGAYVVGLFLAYGIMRVSPQGLGLGLLVAAGLLGVFALDLAVTVLRRRLNGRPLFAGDRSHVYDQLRDREVPVWRVALSAAAAEGAFVVLVLAIDRLVSEPVALAILAVGVAAMLAGLALGGFLRADPTSP
ncbi:MAG: undecaprenyl/decaprenyl-phosphate alpha-N-acetylglucosaminyl 1-phosphate transferase, partial [Actinomycetota bacterium]|nr:undecaprenyl/decaprenyl-phosphate alpha-N-acetylglucosaminyl 1-phosphate transferase [Actinomycetota bacterium]